MYGAYLADSKRVKIKKNVIKNSQSDALVLSSNCDNAYIDNNTIKNNGLTTSGRAVKLYEVDHSVLYNNSIESNEYTGVWLWEDVCGYQGSSTYSIDNSYCEGIEEGCTDSNACNYNSLANTEDSSCEYTSCIDECGVINGDNSSCADCAGVPFGNSVLDNATCDLDGQQNMPKVISQEDAESGFDIFSTFNIILVLLLLGSVVTIVVLLRRESSSESVFYDDDDDEWEDDDDEEFTDQKITPILPPLAPERPDLDAASRALGTLDSSNEKTDDLMESSSELSEPEIVVDDPWADIDKKYNVGSMVKGKVVNLMNYGLFLQLEEGIVGSSPCEWQDHCP